MKLATQGILVYPEKVTMGEDHFKYHGIRTMDQLEMA